MQRIIHPKDHQKKIDKSRQLKESFEKLKKTYPEFSDKIDSVIGTQFNSATDMPQLETLEKLIKSYTTDLEQMRKNDELIKTQNVELAKYSELEAKLKNLKISLLAQCEYPPDLKTHLIEISTQNVSDEKHFSPSQHIGPPIALKMDYQNFQQEVKNYIDKNNALRISISQITSLNEEKEISSTVQAFKEFEKEAKEKIKIIYANYEIKRGLIQSLQNSEKTLSGQYFSEITHPHHVSQDELFCDKHGVYFNNFHPNSDEEAYESKSHLIAPTHTFGVPLCEQTQTLYYELKQNRQDIYKRISYLTITESQTEDDEIKRLGDDILQHSKKIETLDAVFKNHHNVLTYKMNLQDTHNLDKDSTAHLTFWDEQTKKCFHGYGGKEIIHKNVKYRVPTRVYEMMNILNNDYADTASLIKDLEKARGTKPSFWSNPFSYMTRTATTEALYSTPKLFSQA